MERLTEKFSDGTPFIPNIVMQLTNGIQSVISKLADYEDAEEKGLLLKLPCEIGSTLYQPTNSYIKEYKVIGLIFDIICKEWVYEVAYEIGLEWHKTVCDIKSVGETIFFTREEAEQALKQMKGE